MHEDYWLSDFLSAVQLAHHCKARIGNFLQFTFQKSGLLCLFLTVSHGVLGENSHEDGSGWEVGCFPFLSLKVSRHPHQHLEAHIPLALAKSNVSLFLTLLLYPVSSPSLPPLPKQ